MGHPLKQAIEFLAGRCDYAATLDGAGFNRLDTELGHKLAGMSYEDWSTKQRAWAYKAVRKYRKQMLLAQIEYDEIPEPKPNEALEERKKQQKKLASERSISYKDHFFEIRWPKRDPDWGQILDMVRDIPRRQFFNQPPHPFWSAPAEVEQFEKLELLVNEFGFGLLGDAKLEYTLLTDKYIASLVTAKQKAEQDAVRGELSKSIATDSAIEMPELGGTLRPFQKVAVEYALKTKRTLIADVMGLGKTMEALATLEAEEAYPTVVVCPASLQYNWLKEIDEWLPNRRGFVFENGHIPADVDILILNYERLWARHKKSKAEQQQGSLEAYNRQQKEKRKKKAPLREQLAEFKSRGVKAVVLDESHYVKNGKAKRTKAVRTLMDGVDVRLLLTGTPVLNRPVELISQLDVLGILKSEFGGFWKFAQRYCGATHNGYGWDFGGAGNLEELNQRLRETCMIRRTKEDVLPELPAKQRSSIPMEITNRKEYERAEDDLIGWVAEQAVRDETFLESIADLGEDEQRDARRERATDKATRAERAETLVRIEALKQLAARGKMEAVKEWIANFLESSTWPFSKDGEIGKTAWESGDKLVVFAHHQDIQQELLAEYSDAARLIAEDDPRERQAQVDRFQTDDGCRLIICSLTVGREGATLTAASHVAFVELGWTPAVHDQAEDRTYGRMDDPHGTNAWYLLAHDTIDQEIAELIEQKRAVVDQTTDGKVSESAGNILQDLLERLRERRAA